MTLRRPFRPLRPDLDRFLFAVVGDEVNGIPLTVVSALTRLGLDPWEEAGRLSSLSYREAVEQLARLIAEVPGSFRTFGEAREIAGNLVNFLPKHAKPIRKVSPISVPQLQIKRRFRRPAPLRSSIFWAICFVLAAAILAGALAHGGFPFGIGSP